MISLFGLMCVTVLAINATPLLIIRHKLGLLDMKDSNSNFKNRVIELLSCAMCLGFWIGLLYYIILNPLFVSILYGSIIAIGSELINKLLRY